MRELPTCRVMLASSDAERDAVCRARVCRQLRLTTSFVGSELREPVADGRADFIPVFLSETPALFRTRHPLDWAMVQLSPPDRHGYCSAGISVDITLSAIRHARHVIAEINPNVPRTHGDTMVHVDRLDAVIEVDRPLLERRRLPSRNR